MSLRKMFDLLEGMDASEDNEAKFFQMDIDLQIANLPAWKEGTAANSVILDEIKAYQFMNRLSNEQMIARLVSWKDKIASSQNFDSEHPLFKFHKHLGAMQEKLEQDQKEMLGKTRSGRSAVDIAGSLFAEEEKIETIPFGDLLDALESSDIRKISDAREIIKREGVSPDKLKEFLKREIENYKKKHHLSQSDMEAHIDLWIDKFSDPSQFQRLFGKDDLVASLEEINNEFRAKAAAEEAKIIDQRAKIAASPKLKEIIVDPAIPDTVKLFESMQQVAKNKKVPDMGAQLQEWLASYGDPLDQKKLEQAILRYQTAHGLSHQEMVKRLDGWMNHVVGGPESGAFQRGFDKDQLTALDGLRKGFIKAKEKIKQFDAKAVFKPSVSSTEVKQFLEGQMKKWKGNPESLLKSVLEFEAEHSIPHEEMRAHIAAWEMRLTKELEGKNLESKEAEVNQFLDTQISEWSKGPDNLLKNILEFEAKTLTSRQEMLRHMHEWIIAEKASLRRGRSDATPEFLAALDVIYRQLNQIQPGHKQSPVLPFSEALHAVYDDLGKRSPSSNPMWVLKGTTGFLEELDAFDWSAEQNQKIKYGIRSISGHDFALVHGSLEAYQAKHQLSNGEMLEKIDHWKKLIEHSDPGHPASKALNEKLSKAAAAIRKLPKNAVLEDPSAIIVRRIDVCHQYKASIEAEMKAFAASKKEKYPRLNEKGLYQKYPALRVMKNNYDAISAVEKALKQQGKDPALVLEDSNSVLYKHRAILEKPISSKAKGLWSRLLEAFGAIGNAVKTGKKFLAEVRAIPKKKAAEVKKAVVKRGMFGEAKRGRVDSLAATVVVVPRTPVVDARSEPVDDLKEKIDERIRHAQEFKANAENLVWEAIFREMVMVAEQEGGAEAESKVMFHALQNKEAILLAVLENKEVDIPELKTNIPVLIAEMIKDSRFKADLGGYRLVDKLLKETHQGIAAGEKPIVTVERFNSKEPYFVEIAKNDPRLETDTMRITREGEAKKEAKLAEMKERLGALGTTKPKGKQLPASRRTEGLFDRSSRQPEDLPAVVVKSRKADRKHH